MLPQGTCQPEAATMPTSRFPAAVLTLLALGSTIGAQTPADDPALDQQQKKFLKRFQTDLQNRPLNPNAAEQHLAKVQDSFRQLLAVNNQPSPKCADTLATTLYQGLNSGRIPAQTSVLLAREISKVLGSREITYQQVNQFTRTIDPLVRQTGLGPTEQLRLYREAIIILKTVPNYVPESR
jgi:hypothetical protein